MESKIDAQLVKVIKGRRRRRRRRCRERENTRWPSVFDCTISGHAEKR
jgi:transcription elongation factor Elf1